MSYSHHSTVTGVSSYDQARWNDWAPIPTNMIVDPDLSCFLQRVPPGAAGKNETVVPANDSHHVLLFWTEGAPDLNYQTDGRRQRARMNPWSGLHLPPGQSSWCESTISSANGVFHLHISRSLVEETQDPKSKGRVVQSTFGNRVVNGPLQHVAMMIYDYAQTDQSPPRLLWDSFGVVLAHYLVTADRIITQPLRGGLAPWQIRRCTEYLNDRSNQNVGLEELAALVNLSPFHFARAFKQSTGMPPYRYQLELRIARAKVLLEVTNAPVTEIAFEVGYESSQALARIFRKAVGTTPSEYRKRLKL